MPEPTDRLAAAIWRIDNAIAAHAEHAAASSTALAGRTWWDSIPRHRRKILEELLDAAREKVK